MKTKFKIMFAAVLTLVTMILYNNAYAASLTGNSNVYVNDTFTVTFNFGANVGAYDNITVSYDTSMFEYVSGDSLREDVWWDQSTASNGITTKSNTFRAKKEGSSRITVISNGVVSANSQMDSLGTLSAEKLVNVSTKKVQEEKPQVSTSQSVTNGNVNSSSSVSSGNNYLKYLQISEEGLAPAFTRNVTDYAITVGENIDNIEVLARAEDSNARVEIIGGTNLQEGDNTIDIKVTAQNGYYRIYTIIVTKVKDKDKANAFLEDIVIEGFELNKKFQSESLEYSIGEVLSTIKNFNVVASTKDKDAKVEIIGADKLVNDGEGKIIVKVTAPDGITTKEYKIKYEVKAATQDEIENKEMKDYLKDIEGNKNKKELALLYLKYIWAAIKKNYLLCIMYVLVVFEFIQIVILRKKYKRAMDNNNSNIGKTPPPDDDFHKTILKVENENIEDEEKTSAEQIITDEKIKIEPPKVDLIEEPVFKNERVGSIERSGYRAEDGVADTSEKIKLVDLSKNEGPQDELTFNIFDNLNEEDIKQLLSDQIDED